eukprot:298519_1
MEVSPNNIELLVSGFIGHDLPWIVPNGVIQCVVSFSSGSEGTIFMDSRLNDQSDTTVAEASATTQVTKLSLVDLVSVTQYFQNEDPNKKEFCMEMKDRYNAKIGESIKAYKYLCNVCVNPEGKSCSDIGCYIYLENKFKT